MKKIGIDARFCTDHSTGIGRHVEELINHLAKIDTQTQFVCFMKPKIAKIFKAPGKNFTIKAADAPHYSATEQVKFLRQINQHKFDLMVFPQFNLPILYHRKYVVTIHDLTLHLYPGKKKTDFLSRLAYKFIIGRAVKKAQHIFTVSENTRNDLMEIMGVDPQKISVTYNGVSKVFDPIDSKTAQKFRKKHKLPDQYFLYSGVLRTHKNVLGLIHAYSIFLQENPNTNIDLVFSGPQDPTYWPEVEDLVKKLKITKHFHHLGLVPHSEMNQLFGSAWAYIQPSFYEGFGIPPIEAMQCDIPVISSNTSSLPEACGDAAYYFDPEDKTEMVSAMMEIATNKKLRAQLIKNGRRQSQKFSWEKMTHQMYKVYRFLI